MFDFETIIASLGLLGVGGIIGGIIGAYITHFLERKRELARYILDRREKQYKAFLEGALSHYEGWNDEEGKKQFQRSLYTHAPLYASDNVIRVANKFLDSFNERDMRIGGTTDTYYRKLVLEIRGEMKKLLQEKTQLKEDDIKVSSFIKPKSDRTV